MRASMRQSSSRTVRASNSASALRAERLRVGCPEDPGGLDHRFGRVRVEQRLQEQMVQQKRRVEYRIAKPTHFRVQQHEPLGRHEDVFRAEIPMDQRQRRALQSRGFVEQRPSEIRHAARRRFEIGLDPQLMEIARPWRTPPRSRDLPKFPDG